LSGDRSSDREYFDNYYRSYDGQNPPHKLAHYVGEIEAEISTSRPSLLDVGCGRGAFLKYVTENRPDWDAFGSDINTHAANELQAELAGKASVEVGDALSRPFSTRSFDVITAFDVLEHLDDPASALDEFAKWLNPNGIIVFVVPVYDGPTGPAIRLLDRDPTHLQKRARSFWVDLAERKFLNVRWHGIFRFLVTENHYVHIATSSLRRGTPAILVACSGSHS
jgi:SAM-dependent methyltransferase